MGRKKRKGHMSQYATVRLYYSRIPALKSSVPGTAELKTQTHVPVNSLRLPKVFHFTLLSRLFSPPFPEVYMGKFGKSEIGRKNRNTIFNTISVHTQYYYIIQYKGIVYKNRETVQFRSQQEKRGNVFLLLLSYYFFIARASF